MHKPGSDILLGSIEQTPDDLQTLTDNISFNTRFETNLYQHFDNNLLYKYLFDNSKLTYSYQWDQRSDPTIFKRENILKQYHYTYNLIFGKSNIWYPFKDILETEVWKYSSEYYPLKFFKEMVNP